MWFHFPIDEVLTATPIFICILALIVVYTVTSRCGRDASFKVAFFPEDNNFPQELTSYFETLRWDKKERPRALFESRVEPTFTIEQRHVLRCNPQNKITICAVLP